MCAITMHGWQKQIVTGQVGRWHTGDRGYASAEKKNHHFPWVSLIAGAYLISGMGQDGTIPEDTRT